MPSRAVTALLGAMALAMSVSPAASMAQVACPGDCNGDGRVVVGEVVRCVDVAEFGPGNAASGVIGCGSVPLSDLEVEVAQDHNTSPGDRGNGGADLGHPDDPECDDSFAAPRFPIASLACREGSGPDCSTPLNYHLGICNGPRRLTYRGGPTAPGAALIVNRIAIGLLEDGGHCYTTQPRRRDGTCVYEHYGEDCLPCTEDDLDRGVPQTIPVTTATASAVVIDVNNNAGGLIAPGADCVRPCEASAVGAPFDCAALDSDRPDSLSGSALAGCFPLLDSRTLGDNVVCTVLASE